MLDILVGILWHYDRVMQKRFDENMARWQRNSREKWAPLVLNDLSRDIRWLGQYMRAEENAVYHPDAPAPINFSQFGPRYDTPLFFDEWTPEQQETYERLRAIGARMLVRIEKARELREQYDHQREPRLSA